MFVLSAFLDNIAAALIGGTIANVVFRGKVHIGYLAGIVAASNAGGSGSVVGDTTTTMMWIGGVSPLDVVHAYIAAGHRVDRLRRAGGHSATPPCADRQAQAMRDVAVDWARVAIVVVVLVTAIATNIVANVAFPIVIGRFPLIGAAVWVALLATAPLRKPDWSLLPETMKGTALPAVTRDHCVDDAR